MADDIYTPPESTNLPFNFSEKGYTSPSSTDLQLNFTTPGTFGNLRAAVNVLGKYWYETYTYLKSCPKYVIGYGSPSGVQVIQGRCVYGGIRDLRASITATQVVISERDLSASVTGRLRSGQSDLGGHMRLRQSGQSNLPANIEGWYQRNLGASFEGTHSPENLLAYVSGRHHEQKDLNAYLRGWQASDLQGLIGVMQVSSLSASIGAIEPGDLPAYIKPWPQGVLPATIYSWSKKDLGAYVNSILKSNLGGLIHGRDDMFGDLGGRLKGIGSAYDDLPAYLKPWGASDLQGILNPVYYRNLPASILPIAPINLPALLHAWHTRDLQGIINGQDYPWNLPASINPVGQWSNLNAIINPLAGTQHYKDLPGYIHPWQPKDLSAYISADDAPYLRATLIPVGHASNLHASLTPKVMRLTTVVGISTMAHKNLTAMINSPCFYTGYKNLLASVYPTFKGDLAAYVRPIVYDYKPALLGAKVGYADSYLEVDKLSLNISVKPNDFYTLDKYKLMVNILNSGNFLTASIRGTLRYHDLTAYISGQEIESYTYDSLIKNRERVVHKTYDGIFKSFETVEMAFKSAVQDYYYSSAGDYAWKKDRLERWMLDVRSILPADTALRLKRRLHRATELYDLKKFVTVDEAVRFAIAYVTEYPQANLSASIINKGTFASLGCILNPRHVQSSRQVLSSSITPIGDTVVVSSSNSISKI